MWWVRLKTLLISSSYVDGIIRIMCRYIRSEFKIFHLMKLEKAKENWHEHVLRMTTDGLPQNSTQLYT
jgi:hypothetical protein